MAENSKSPRNGIDHLSSYEELIRRKVNKVKPQYFKRLPNSVRLDEKSSPKLSDIDFPKEHEEIRLLTSLDKDSLREKRILSILNDPSKTFDVYIKKQIALTALQWAQAELDSKVVKFRNFTLTNVQNLDSNEKNSIFDMKFPNKGIINCSKLRQSDMLRIEYGPNPNQVLDKCRVVNIDLHKSVVRVKCDDVKLPINKDIENLSDSSKNTRAFELHPLSSFQAIIRILSRLEKEGSSHVNIGKYSEDQDNTDFTPDSKVIEAFKKVHNVNDGQALAMWRVCISPSGKLPFILHGPCGTGKTKLIVTISLCLMDLNRQHRILICAPTNDDADTIARNMMNLSKNKGLKILRLRAFNNDYHGRDTKLDPIFFLDRVKGNFAVPNRQQFEKYDVIICTPVCSKKLKDNDIPFGFFSHIFIDEASLMKNGDYLIPIENFATDKTSVILCGDRMQMSPVSQLDQSLAEYIAEDSVLDYYLKHKCYKDNSRLIHLLTQSYLLLQPMSDIIGKVFYKEDPHFTGLTFKPSEELKKFLLNEEFPIIFYQTCGSEESGFIKNSEAEHNENPEVYSKSEMRCYSKEIIKRDYSHITRNIVQADEVVEKMEKLLGEDGGFKVKDVAIMSPYRDQSGIIQNNLRQVLPTYHQKIHVKSVERFQGSTYPVILMSTTKTDEPGFLSEKRRIYTAITRAKDLLVIYGDAECLKSSTEWEKLIEKCEEMKSYRCAKNQNKPKDEMENEEKYKLEKKKKYEDYEDYEIDSLSAYCSESESS